MTIKLGPRLVYDNRYIKSKYEHMVIKFTLILPVKMFQKMVHNVNLLQTFLQVYLDNCAYKTIYNWLKDFLDDNHFETDED